MSKINTLSALAGPLLFGLILFPVSAQANPLIPDGSVFVAQTESLYLSENRTNSPQMMTTHLNGTKIRQGSWDADFHSCFITVNTPPLTKPVIPRGRSFRTRWRYEPSGILRDAPPPRLELLDPSSGALVASVRCGVYNYNRQWPGDSRMGNIRGPAELNADFLLQAIGLQQTQSPMRTRNIGFRAGSEERGVDIGPADDADAISGEARMIQINHGDRGTIPKADGPVELNRSRAARAVEA